MSRFVALAAMTLVLAGCQDKAPSAEGEAPKQRSDVAADLPAPTPVPSAALDLSALQSRDCRAVMAFYASALKAGEFDNAARVWPLSADMTGAALRTFYGGPVTLSYVPDAIQQEGAAGSSYCEVQVKAERSGRAAQDGSITLRRANDVPGATTEQLRWHVDHTSFGEDAAATARKRG